MTPHTRCRSGGLALLLALLFTLPPAHAQSLAVEVAGAGFATPLGVEIDALGQVWVAASGTGADDGSITVFTPEGVPHPVLTGLRSISTTEGVGGINQIRLHEGLLWIAQGLSNEVPEGYLYALDVSGFTPGDAPFTVADLTEAIDVGSLVLAAGFAETNPYDLAPNADGSVLYFTDSGANAVFAYDRATASLSTIAALPPLPNPTPIGPPVIQAVPTGLVYDDGVLFVSAFTGFPFVSGLSTVYRIEGGAMTVYRDGLTGVTDLALDPEDHALVAVQFAEFDLASGFLPGTGRLTKLLPDGTSETLATGLNLTPAVAIAGDHHYITSLFGLLHRASPLVDLDVMLDASASASAVPRAASLSLTNTTEEAKTVNLAVTAVLPDGTTRTRSAQTHTLAPGETMTRSFGLRAPSDASGLYRFVFAAEDDSGMVYDRVAVTLDLGEEGRQATDGLALNSSPTASNEQPGTVCLTAAYPNPVRSATTLRIEVAEPSAVSLAVYDALGRQVAVLTDGVMETGFHSVRFDATGLPAGLYLIRLTAAGVTQTHRVTVSR